MFQVTQVCKGKAYELYSENGVSVSKTELKETDTRVVLYAKHVSQLGYKCINVRSPDSDIFFILLHFASQIESTVLFDTGSGNHRWLINVTDIETKYGQHHCTALMAMNAYTGCDTTSAFKEVGKQKPVKLLQRKPRFEATLCKLGDEWELPQEVYDELEHVICSLYGKDRFQKIDSFRLHLLKQKCETDGKLDPSRNVDMASLPPCSKTLRQHTA